MGKPTQSENGLETNQHARLWSEVGSNRGPQSSNRGPQRLKGGERNHWGNTGNTPQGIRPAEHDKDGAYMCGSTLHYYYYYYLPSTSQSSCKLVLSQKDGHKDHAQNVTRLHSLFPSIWTCLTPRGQARNYSGLFQAPITSTVVVH